MVGSDGELLPNRVEAGPVPGPSDQGPGIVHNEESENLSRSLQQRTQMIAIAGAIVSFGCITHIIGLCSVNCFSATGLFLGLGGSIQTGGRWVHCSDTPS